MSQLIGNICQRKIFNDIKLINSDPLDNIYAFPDSNNVLIWYFLIIGPEFSKYKSGHYIGQILHDPEYPFKPPDYVMLTPSGRFIINQKICMSNTKFHTQEWSTSWNIKTILIGFLSIMLDDNAYGISHIHENDNIITNYANASVEFNKTRYPEIYNRFLEIMKQHQEKHSKISNLNINSESDVISQSKTDSISNMNLSKSSSDIIVENNSLSSENIISEKSVDKSVSEKSVDKSVSDKSVDKTVDKTVSENIIFDWTEFDMIITRIKTDLEKYVK